MTTSMPFDTRKDFFEALRSHVPKEVLQMLPADPEEKNMPAEVASLLETGAQDFAGFAATAASKPYTCCTEVARDFSDPLALWVGFNGEVPRWKKGSVVNWAVQTTGFTGPDVSIPKLPYPVPRDAVLAGYSMNRACAQWNALAAGVTFQWVSDIDDAAFVVRYGGDLGSVYARAYFPNNDVLNTVSVYKLSFEQDQVRYMTNVFLHEVGHVLGLRHEFAGDSETGAVRFGASNTSSVMSYQWPPTIQPSDVSSLKAFYTYSGRIGGLKVAEKIPDN